MADIPERDFSKFSRHVDGTLENIAGKHVNDLQDAINNLEKDNIDLHSRVFLDEALFVLKNNPYVNYMHYVDFSNADQIFRNESSDWKISSTEKCLKINNNEKYAIVHTIALKSEYGDVNNILLKVDEEINFGTAIKYYVSNDMQNYHPIKPNASVPFEFEAYAENLYLKVELLSNKETVSPELFAVALFCSDKTIEEGLVITDPPTVDPGTGGDPGNGGDPVLPDCCEEYIGDLLLTYDEVTGDCIKVERANGEKVIDIEYDENQEFVAAVSTTLYKKIRTEVFKDEQGRVNIVRTTEEEV